MWLFAEMQTGTGLGAVQRLYYANGFVVCSVQLYSVLCALHCATQPVQYSVLCTALCNTACPSERSVRCIVQHSLSIRAFCALHCATQPVHYSALYTAPMVQHMAAEDSDSCCSVAELQK